MRPKVFKALAMATVFSLVAVRPAFAYIDPNEGGMLFQALAAGFAVISGILLLFSRQIRMAIGRVRRSLRSTESIDQLSSKESAVKDDESVV